MAATLCLFAHPPDCSSQLDWEGDNRHRWCVTLFTTSAVARGCGSRVTVSIRRCQTGSCCEPCCCNYSGGCSSTGKAKFSMGMVSQTSGLGFCWVKSVVCTSASGRGMIDVMGP
ncbi:hypothetical protein B0H10DRAFT_2006730 [Mycena sp. CBHHK59/15]|nr:hypothetical protein B0H10DRAFT_2006730 [Mycena sp. CBHHK59/15]